METKHKALPEVGSKWVALVDQPRMAGISRGDVVSIVSASEYVDYISLDGGEWTCNVDYWHYNFRPLETEKAPTESTAEASLGEGSSGVGYTPKNIKEKGPFTGKIASDGGSSTYYDFPKGCDTLNDLIEYKGMSFAQGNIFKAAYRLGNKEGISLEYDLKKIKYYADRMLNQIKEGE